MKKFKPTIGIRGRILVIALIPSLALLSTGVAVSGYLVRNGIDVRNWAKQITAVTAPAIDLTTALQQERRITLAKIAGTPISAHEYSKARLRTNTELQAAAIASAQLRELAPAAIDQVWATFSPLTAELPAMRAKVNANSLPATDAYNYFTQMITLVEQSLNVVITTAPDPVTTIQETTAVGLFDLEESASRSAALTPFATAKAGFSPAQLTEFTGQVGYYHREAANMQLSTQGQDQATLLALMSSPDWKQVSGMEDAVIHRTVGTASTSGEAGAPANATDWQNAANRVSDELLALYKAHQERTLKVVGDDGNRIARNAFVGGGSALALSLVALAFSLWLSTILIGRLRRLRNDTLVVANEQLPDVMRRVREGDTVDIEAEVAHLNYGRDEIGQVADAFNKAQHAAVTAAVTEAKTQDGVKAVFLNIAHRSQVVIHKQLEILEKAEHDESDSARLAVLFTLDHLATRERRNAENLIILGGEQPGRRWRSSVALLDLVRSAVAETEDFARVHITRMPEQLINGSAVADLIHLLAELVDNATSFSPPESRVDIIGTVVGKGIAIEIADQGLGMAAEEMERVNETLRNPPDFSVASLSSDSRLGLFVVARLANRTGTTVRFTESDFGGVRVIVIMPTTIIAPAIGSSPHQDELPQAPEESKTGPVMVSGVYSNGVTTNGLAAAMTTASSADNGVDTNEYSPNGFGTGDFGNGDFGNGDFGGNGFGINEPTADDNGSVGGLDPNDPAFTAGRHSVEDKPSLPRRSRQTNLAPQLVFTEAAPEEPSAADAPRPRTPEQSRDLFAAIEDGTRQARSQKMTSEGEY